MEPTNPQDHPIFEHDAFDLAHRLLDEGPRAPRRPDDFGPYRFVEEEPLGRGSMSEVWLAEEEISGRHVAIKFLRNVIDPAAWARHEAKHLGRLRNQFIAVLYNHDVLEDGTPWLAMEYVKGERLDTYCAKNSLSAQQRLVLFQKVCQGVHYAHTEGLIHGDLKPANILVTDSGEPKLVDFGLAGRSPNLDGGNSPSPVALGLTPGYASPEQFRSGEINTKVDVYALGVILYELLTGTLPIQRSTVTQGGAVETNSAIEKPPAPSTRVRPELGAERAREGAALRPSEWKDLDAICLKAIDSDSNARYETVQSLIQDLERFRKCEPVAARAPHAWPYLVGKFVKRNRTAVVAAGVVFLVFATLIAYFTQGLANERNRALAAVSRTRRIQHFMEQLLTAGDSQAGPSRQLTMASALDRAAKLAPALDKDPEAQAELYETLGRMFEHLGRYAEADRLLQMGLDKARTAADNPDLLGNSQVQLGLLRSDQARYQEAEKLVKDGLATLEKTHRRADDNVLVTARAALGKVLVESGAYDRGIALLEPIAARSPAGEEDQVTLLDSISTLAVAHHYAGHPDRAEALNRRALEFDRRNATHPRVALDLANIGTTKVLQGKFGEAEALYREAAQIEEAWYGADHPDTVQLRSLIAMAVLQAGRFAEAEPLLRSVLAQQELAYETKIHPSMAFTHDVLAKLAVRQGKLAEAEQEFQRSADIDRQLFGPEDYKTAVETGNLADVLVREGQYQRAEETMRPAVAALTRQPRPGDPAVGISQAILGRALLKQKRFQEAEKPLLAGYEILKSGPPQYRVRLQDARQDLAEVYESLGQTSQGERFRSEWTAAAGAANPAGKK